MWVEPAPSRPPKGEAGAAFRPNFRKEAQSSPHWGAEGGLQPQPKPALDFLSALRWGLEGPFQPQMTSSLILSKLLFAPFETNNTQQEGRPNLPKMENSV